MRKRFVSAIVPAAGSATRMGGEKQRLLLKGRPVLAHTLTVLQNTLVIDEIVVVARAADLEEFSAYKERFKLTKLKSVVLGGDSRQQSVSNGLAAISSEATMVAVHDGARPLVTAEEIERIVAAAEEHGAATAATPVKDTLKIAGEDGTVAATPDRSTLWAVQTPQVFWCDRYRDALKKAAVDGRDFTDDCQLFEYSGYAVHLVQTGYQNIKITTPEDMAVAHGLLGGGEMEMRIGHGYDVHRLAEGRALILGGVTVPYEKGLLGHSDADVLTHAVMDALLGAAGLHDIGCWFPDTDERFRGADSIKLLEHVIALLAERGFTVGNVDATVLAQAPKLLPYIDTMRENLARACGVKTSAVNVKATTEEKMGFTGAGDGMAAHAVCIIKEEV
ncbi:MAG: 2-C-methyl-D-erythritol 2,4-cyclodiphosphate synthase [Ruminococcaceae bacterium]|nr:2-C-methyl-D-erythritol 2,4-cyclodiphosphate synthase [Oscillospiraceae bacterium]